MSADISIYHCPSCGEPRKHFREGLCELCWIEQQRDLEEHNAHYDWWVSLSKPEREAQIRWAIR